MNIFLYQSGGNRLVFYDQYGEKNVVYVYVYVSVCHAFLKSYLLPHFWGDTFETFCGDTLGNPAKKYFLTFLI